MGIGITPLINEFRQFVFAQAHIQSTHGNQGTNRAAVPECQLCNLSFLSQVRILAVLFYWNTKHL